MPDVGFHFWFYSHTTDNTTTLHKVDTIPIADARGPYTIAVWLEQQRYQSFTLVSDDITRVLRPITDQAAKVAMAAADA